jgi:pyruvate kinase
VTPVLITETGTSRTCGAHAVDAAREAGIVEDGDRVVITAGTAVNIPGTTNVIKVDVVVAKDRRTGRQNFG